MFCTCCLLVASIEYIDYLLVYAVYAGPSMITSSLTAVQERRHPMACVHRQFLLPEEYDEVQKKKKARIEESKKYNKEMQG